MVSAAIPEPQRKVDEEWVSHRSLVTPPSRETLLQVLVTEAVQLGKAVVHARREHPPIAHANGAAGKEDVGVVVAVRRRVGSQERLAEDPRRREGRRRAEAIETGPIPLPAIR